MISLCDDIVHFGTMISKLRLGCGIFESSICHSEEQHRCDVGIKATAAFRYAGFPRLRSEWQRIIRLRSLRDVARRQAEPYFMERRRIRCEHQLPSLQLPSRLKVATPYVTNKCSDLFVTGRLRQNICQAILKRWVTSVLHSAQSKKSAHRSVSAFFS